jgi:hypothetical protein
MKKRKSFGERRFWGLDFVQWPLFLILATMIFTSVNAFVLTEEWSTTTRVVVGLVLNLVFLGAVFEIYQSVRTHPWLPTQEGNDGGGQG